MFERDYTFKGKHANIVTQLTTEIDSDTKFKLFERNIDVLIIAPIVGYLYGKMSKRDDEGLATDNVKKINFDQMNRESKTLNFNYELIMLLHNKDKLPIESRLNNAFRYNSGTEQKEECDKVFEQYVLGGIEILEEKLLRDASVVDDYINNIYNFISEYNSRYNEEISEEDILEICTNSN